MFKQERNYQEVLPLILDIIPDKYKYRIQDYIDSTKYINGLDWVWDNEISKFFHTIIYSNEIEDWMIKILSLWDSIPENKVKEFLHIE